MTKIYSLVCAGIFCAFSLSAMGQNTHAFLWDSVHGMQDLGTLGGNNSYANGINASGEVVGYSYLADNVTFHAFTWTPTTGLVDIGATLAGMKTYGAGINASGNVAGTAIETDLTALPSFFHPPASWRQFPLGSNVSDQNRAYGLNDRNQVTGQIVSEGTHTGYLWTPLTGAITYFPPARGSETIGVAVNNHSHATGAGSTASFAYDAIFWSANTGTHDIGSLNGSGFTAGGAISDQDEIVGYTLPELYGFYWTRQTGMMQLQSLGGSVDAAFGINRSGTIAGESSLTSGVIHAVFWNGPLSAPTDLGTLGGANSYAKGINDSAQIVGYSQVP